MEIKFSEGTSQTSFRRYVFVSQADSAAATHVVVQDGGFTIEFEDGFVEQSWHQVVATLELTDADCPELVGVDQQEQLTRAAHEQEKQEQGLATGTASCTATSQQQNLRNAPTKSGPAVRSEERASPPAQSMSERASPPARCSKRTAAVVAQCRMATHNADEYDFKTEVNRANQSLLSQALVGPDWIDCGLNLNPNPTCCCCCCC